MNLIEYAISLLAPHCCVVCGTEGQPVCGTCADIHYTPVPLVCYRCGAESLISSICAPCSREIGISNAWIATDYSELPRQTVALLKFQRVKAAAEVISGRIERSLPRLAPHTLLCPVPTANARIRARGYDQACLIARSIAQRRKLPYKELLIRQTSTRQVGASRTARFKQLEGAFRLRGISLKADQPILLIDDVLTTGATLQSAARLLKAHSATRVDVAVFAHSFKKEGLFPSSTRIVGG